MRPLRTAEGQNGEAVVQDLQQSAVSGGNGGEIPQGEAEAVIIFRFVHKNIIMR